MRRPILFAAAFLAATVTVASPSRVAAQAKVPGVRGDFLASMGGLQKKFEALTDAFPQDKFEWRPGKGVRSVCEVFVHITGENYEIGKAFNAVKAPAEFADPEKDTCIGDKARVKAALMASFNAINTAVTNLKDADLDKPYTLFGAPLPRRQWLLNTAEHAGEHLGQLVAYARVNNIVPPWSK